MEVTAPGVAAVSAKVAAVREAANFAPVIGGAAFKDGRIVFAAPDGGAQASFTVQNPAGARARRVEILFAPPLQHALAVTPSVFDLPPGGQRVVFLTDAALAQGQTTGTMTIRDATEPALAVDVLVSASRGWSAVRRTAVLFVLVFFGALLSVVLNNIFPVSLAKRLTRESLTEAESVIQGLSGASSVLQAALMAETARLRLLNGQFSWYTTTKAEQMKQVEVLLASLKSSIAIADSIARLRAAIQLGGRIATRDIVALEERLSDAEDSLMDGKQDLAKATVDEVAHLRTAALADAALAGLREQLVRDVAQLLAMPASQGNRPQAIEQILADLRQSAPTIGGLSREDLLDLEGDYQIAHVFIRDFEPHLERDSNLLLFQDRFVAMLRSDVAAAQTRLLVALARQGLAPEDIAQRIGAGKGEVSCADKVRVYRMAEFAFRFSDPAIQVIVAARRLCSYSWDFGDASITPPHDRCQHFFTWTKGDAVQTGWAPVARAMRFLQSNQPQEEEGAAIRRVAVTVTVTVTPPVGTSVSPKAFTRNIVLLPKAEHGWGAIGMQVSTFFVSFLVAVCAAYGTQYATLPTIDSLSSWFAPFLFGFSLDQVRDRTTKTS